MTKKYRISAVFEDFVQLQVLKTRLPDMQLEEKLTLLATDGMLVKRPIIVDGDLVLTGFKESEWEERILGKFSE